MSNAAGDGFGRQVHTRRNVVVALLTAVLVPGIPDSSDALTSDEAGLFVRQLIGDILQASNSARSDEEFYRSFERILDRYADLPVVARTTLGRSWRSANDRQRMEYVHAYRTYLSRKYGRTLRQMTDGRIEVGRARKVKSFYEVASVARFADGREFEVLWHISDRSGRSRLFNLVIEGISMLSRERTEIVARLRQFNGSIDRRSADLANSVS